MTGEYGRVVHWPRGMRRPRPYVAVTFCCREPPICNAMCFRPLSICACEVPSGQPENIPAAWNGRCIGAPSPPARTPSLRSTRIESSMPSQKPVGAHVAMMLCLVVTIGAISHVEASSGWSLVASMSTPRTGHTATLLPDGRVLVSGGQWSDQSGDDGGFATVEASSEIYDPRQGAWLTTASMSTPRYLHTATLLPDGRVLVSGGYNDTSCQLHHAEV
jgi:hypothetical protein